MTILERAQVIGGLSARDLAAAGLDSDSETRLACVKVLIALGSTADLEDRLEKIIVTGLAEGDMNQQVAYMGVASQWNLRRVQAGLWAMLQEGRGEKRIRAAAIAALVSLGPEAVPPATKLLAAKAPPARMDAALPVRNSLRRDSIFCPPLKPLTTKGFLTPPVPFGDRSTPSSKCQSKSC